MALRQATEADLTEIETLALATHPELMEQREVFAEKLELFPEGCLVLVRNGRVAGYGFLPSWAPKQVPAFNQFLLQLPRGPEWVDEQPLVSPEGPFG